MKSIILVVAIVFVSFLSEAQPFRMPRALTDTGAHKKINVIYFIPTDRAPQLQYIEKISTILTFAADIIASSFESHFMHGRQLNFDLEGDFVKVHIVKGSRAAAYYYESDPWNKIRIEVERAGFRKEESLQMIFAETYELKAISDDGTWPRGDFALGQFNNRGGGMAMVASWLLMDKFSSPRIEEMLALLVAKQEVGTRTRTTSSTEPLGKFISSGVGAVAHELGHALGLMHDRSAQKNAFDNSLMGLGYMNIYANYFKDSEISQSVGFSIEQSKLLVSSPFLNTQADLGDTEVPTLQVLGSTPINENTVYLQLALTDNVALSSIIFHSPVEDSLLSGYSLSSSEAEPRVFTRIPKDKTGNRPLWIFYSDINGNISIYDYVLRRARRHHDPVDCVRDLLDRERNKR